MNNLDLNLLKIFNILYEERSVTRAGDRLGLTQSAVSHALRRLRHSAGDRLFVRVGHRLEPTARATVIAPHIRAGIDGLINAMLKPEFNPKRSTREFRIMASPYFCRSITPKLLRTIREEAPLVTLRVVMQSPDFVSQLDQGLIDIALMAEKPLPQHLRMTELFQEQLVWIGGARYGNLAKADMHALPAHGARVLISGPGHSFVPHQFENFAAPQPPAEVRDASHAEDAGSNISSVVYDAATAIAMVRQTDTIAMVPRRLAEAEAAQGKIVILDQPEKRPSLPVTMVWHTRSDEDSGMEWLRSTIVALPFENDD
jgi:DNA-binding transcriptional LysR family regulator